MQIEASRPDVGVMMPNSLKQTEAYDTYWRFASERLSIFYKRLEDPNGPWTDDPILQNHRFTNTFRAVDRVSQYLIQEVQYRKDRSQAPDELFFRTMLFKFFNKIETWELIETQHGTIGWQSADLSKISAILSMAMKKGARIYNPAYIMPSPNFGHTRKHENHLALLSRMMNDNLPSKMSACLCLEDAYLLMLSYPGLGPFLAYQYVIDLNYSTLTNFSEAEFVVAGPGALDGISKCFESLNGHSAEDIIQLMVELQDTEFSRLSIEFPGLFGRPLQPIDCQNLFCEVSKYTRLSHPHIKGKSARTRIKQKFDITNCSSYPIMLPPKWKITIPKGAKSDNNHNSDILKLL